MLTRLTLRRSGVRVDVKALQNEESIARLSNSRRLHHRCGAVSAGHIGSRPRLVQQIHVISVNVTSPSATLVVWTSAWLHGVAAADDVLDALHTWADQHEV